MSQYQEMMDRLDLTVHSPDKNIRGRLTNRTQITLTFAPGSYRMYADWTLSRQLAAVSQLLWVGRRRASLTAQREALGETTAETVEVPRNPEEREYFEKRAEIEVTAESASGWVTAAMTGWTRWRIELAARTVQSLDEFDFCHEAVTVFPSMLKEYQRQHALLLDELHRTTRPEYFDYPREGGGVKRLRK